MARFFHVVASLLTAQLAAGVCVDPSCFTNLTWTYDATSSNITFTGTCSALPLGNYPVTWCAFGISPSGLMVRYFGAFHLTFLAPPPPRASSYFASSLLRHLFFKATPGLSLLRTAIMLHMLFLHAIRRSSRRSFLLLLHQGGQ